MKESLEAFLAEVVVTILFLVWVGYLIYICVKLAVEIYSDAYYFPF
jgi:hypothetical protein